MKAALACGVFGLFRCGELTIDSSHESFLPRSALTEIGLDHYRIHLVASKTDIFPGADAHLVANGSSTCPVAALRALLALPRDPPSAPLFRMANVKPLSRTSLLKFMSSLLRACGIDPQGYAGHSMRRGGAQALFGSGVS